MALVLVQIPGRTQDAQEDGGAEPSGRGFCLRHRRRRATKKGIHRPLLYYYAVASPQARYARRLDELEDPKTEDEKEALFYETYDHDRERYEELAAQGFFNLPKEKEDPEDGDDAIEEADE
jgi:hypothetical protein